MAVVTEHIVKTGEHQTFYLTAGPESGPPVILCHGWPELSISWRHQLQCLGDLGFRAIAPDMRGYGRSTVYPRHEDYALVHTVGDMIGLADARVMQQTDRAHSYLGPLDGAGKTSRDQRRDRALAGYSRCRNLHR